MPDTPIAFDTNGLYILLSDIGAERQFHWGFYLAKSANHGEIFHLINNEDTGFEWQYQRKSSTSVPSSKTLVFALKIAVMDPSLHGPLAERFAAVSTAPPITCRLWIKRALFHLDDEGYIKLKAAVDSIEEEAVDTAFNNKQRGLRTTRKSRGSVA